MSKDTPVREASVRYSRVQEDMKDRDRQLRHFLLHYLPVVKSEVIRFKMRLPRHIEAEDLQGVALCVLMRAFERFTHTEDTSFAAYVRQRVRGAILDELRRLDTLTRSARRKAGQYDDALEAVEQREGRMATQDEIRRELGMDEDTYNGFLDDLRPVTFLSLDDRPHGEDSLHLSDKLDDANGTTASEKLESREMRDLVRERIDQLPSIQQKILHMYYFKDFRLAEIATVFGLSESRICQLHTQAIRSLRVVLRRHYQKEESANP